MKIRINKLLRLDRNYNRDKRSGRDYYQAGISAWLMNAEAVNCAIVVQRLKQVTKGLHWWRTHFPAEPQKEYLFHSKLINRPKSKK